MNTQNVAFAKEIKKDLFKDEKIPKKVNVLNHEH